MSRCDSEELSRMEGKLLFHATGPRVQGMWRQDGPCEWVPTLLAVWLEPVLMKTLKYKGELYTCSVPRPIGGGMYTCDAWKQKTGREIKNPETLNALRKVWFKSKGVKGGK